MGAGRPCASASDRDHQAPSVLWGSGCCLACVTCSTTGCKCSSRCVRPCCSTGRSVRAKPSMLTKTESSSSALAYTKGLYKPAQIALAPLCAERRCSQYWLCGVRKKSSHHDWLRRTVLRVLMGNSCARPCLLAWQWVCSGHSRQEGERGTHTVAPRSISAWV